MSQRKVTRREVLRIAGMSGIGVVLAACAPQQTQVIKETVPAEVVKQTVVVKEEVEVVKEVTATASPALKEAPMLAELVAQGKLPPLDERLPENPLVIPPISEVGQYGGILRQYAPNTTTFHDLHWVREANWLRRADDCYFNEGEKGFVPHRAESVTSNDDMTEFVVKLRKGMKWSDGEPVTADDVMWNFTDVIGDPDLKDAHWSYSGVYPNNFPTVTKVDDFTIKFEFKEPATDFLNNHSGWMSNQGLGMGEAPVHYLKQFHIKYNPDADKNAKAAGYDNWQAYYVAMSQAGTNQINVDLPTINCWMLKSHTDTQNIYVRNPYFWAVDSVGNQLPYIDGLIIEAVSDSEVAKLKMIAGDFDLAGVFLIQLNEYPLLKKNEQIGKYLIILNKGNVTAKPMICPNLNHKDPVLRELFQKPDFHKALSYAINRDEINQIAFAGLGVGMQDIYTIWDHVDPSKWQKAYTEFDPEKAKEMLDSLGLKKGSDGNYLRPDGQPLTLNLQTIVEEGWGNTVELVAKHWSDIGIPSQYSPTARDLWSERNTANELDFFIWHDYSYSESATHAQGGWGGWSLGEKAWNWFYWLDSDGKDPKGEEPPDEWKQHWADVQALKSSEYGSDEYKQLMEKIWNFRIMEQLYVIGTIGDYPTPLLVKYDIGNVGNNDVPFNYWQGQYPEQWYWKDPARSAERVP